MSESMHIGFNLIVADDRNSVTIDAEMDIRLERVLLAFLQQLQTERADEAAQILTVAVANAVRPDHESLFLEWTLDRDEALGLVRWFDEYGHTLPGTFQRAAFNLKNQLTAAVN